MSTRLAQLIYEVDKHFGFKRVLVVAGYRAPRIAREKGNPKSPHKKGVACDFRIEGVTNTELRDFERTLPHVGVGYYPNSEFVHLDCDPSRNQHSAFWIDYSRPGERAHLLEEPRGRSRGREARGRRRRPTGTDEDNELAPMPALNPLPHPTPSPGARSHKCPATRGRSPPIRRPICTQARQNP